MKRQAWIAWGCVILSSVAVFAAQGQDAEAVVMSLAEVDVQPIPQRMEAPTYPAEMKHAAIEGSVTVGMVITAQGNVSDIVVEESNNPWFERPAIEAAVTWRFKPAMHQGRPVNCRVKQTLRFVVASGERDLWWVSGRRPGDDAPEEIRWEKAPQWINTAFPVYPYEDLLEGRNAEVTCNVLIGVDGTVVGLRFLNDVPDSFAGAVEAMLGLWKFDPARKADGQSSSALVMMKLQFKADGTGNVPVLQPARAILRDIAKSKTPWVALSELNAPPRQIADRVPAYPMDLRRRGIVGSAEVEFFIDSKGDVQLPRIVSATHPDFGPAAVQCASCWRFEAPRKGKKAVVTKVRRTVRFVLADEDEEPADETAKAVPPEAITEAPAG